jgi:hypothetical protein
MTSIFLQQFTRRSAIKRTSKRAGKADKIHVENNNKSRRINLSRRRKVESKQLANMQLPSFDNVIQLTGCPKLSDISLENIKSNIIIFTKNSKKDKQTMS